MKTIISACIIVLLIIGCNEKPEIVTMTSGLKYVTNTHGDGREAKIGDLVSIHFKGWIVKDSANYFEDWSGDSTKIAQIIADSKVMGKPYKFVLGEGAFIKGTDRAIAGMKPGGKRTVIIPSRLAYGDRGLGPVPPNTDLKIVIELLEVKDAVHVEKWEIDSSKIKTTESGLKYVVISPGKGPKPESGDTVLVHYTGWLENGKKFDSSYERDEPISFTLGKGQVIPGWDEGISILNEGSKAVLIIPPSLAYGARQNGPIPPNSTLIFDVELVEVKKNK